MLLRAFEALRIAGVDARLTVAGATDEEVEPMLLDAEGVRVAGRVTDEEKWRLLGEADILCAPSLGGESFGMVLTESFASSTPVVASDIAGYRDVVRDGVDGMLVPAADPRRWARRCARLRSTPPAVRRCRPPRASAPSASPGRGSPTRCWRPTATPSRCPRAGRRGRASGWCRPTPRPAVRPRRLP